MSVIRISSITGERLYIDGEETRKAVISISSESAITYDVPNNLDWHWFSSHGFLDTTSGSDAWTWLK